jgi:hypothetical protein
MERFSVFGHGSAVQTGHKSEAAMTIQQRIKASGTPAAEAGVTTPQETASYLLDLVRGLRRLTGQAKDLQFLDYLLAVAEEEAQQVSARQYH